MRVNESGLDQLKLFGPHPRSAVSETTNLDAKPLSESHDKQFPTRVSNHPTQLQVLPTQTCRNKEHEKSKKATSKQTIQVTIKKYSDKKRNLDAIFDQLDTSSKCHHALWAEDGASFILLSIELSQAQEPTYRKGDCRDHMGKRSLYRVFGRDNGR